MDNKKDKDDNIVGIQKLEKKIIYRYCKNCYNICNTISNKLYFVKI